MNDNASHENDIIDLLQYKSWSELSAVEKTLVSKHLTEEAYNDMRITYNAIQTVEHDVASFHDARADIKNKALSFMRKDKPTSIIVRIASYKVPAWQSIAAMLIIAVALFMLQRYTQNQTIAATTLTHTDTVFLDKGNIITEHDTVYMTKQSASPAVNIITPDNQMPSAPANTSPVSDEKLTTEMRQSMLSTAHVMSVKQKLTPTGTSIDEDSLLKKFKFVAL